MKTKNTLLFASLISALAFQCLTQKAFASGREGGNGGTILECVNSDGKTTSVEFTDIYEARTRGMSPSMGSITLSPTQKVKEILQAFALRSPIRAALYLKWLDSFEKDRQFITDNEEFAVDPDTGSILIPKNCKLKWLTIYKDPVFPEDDQHPYHIIQKIWDRLDHDNQAAAILHELIYREFTTLTHQTTSERARYFNSYLFSGKMKALSPGDFVQAHVRSEAGYVDMKGILVQLQTIDEGYSSWNFRTAPTFQNEPKPTFYADGSVAAGQILNWDYISTSGGFAGISPIDKLKSLLQGTEDLDQLNHLRGLSILSDFSYYTAGGKRLAIGNYGSGEKVEGERVTFSPKGTLSTFAASSFQPYIDAENEGFKVKVSDRSDFNLFYCGYGVHLVSLQDDGMLWTYESTHCGVSELSLEETSKAGSVERLEITSTNSGYPCGSFFLGAFGGRGLKIDNSKGCKGDDVIGYRDGVQVIKGPILIIDPENGSIQTDISILK